MTNPNVPPVLGSENIAANAPFDIDKALNAKPFIEFLTKYPDADTLDMNDEETIKQRYEAFQAKEKVKKELKDIFKGHIKEKMKLNLADKDLEAIDKHIDTMAVGSGEELVAWQKRIESFRKLPQEINTLTQRIREIATKSGEIQTELEKAAEHKGDVDYVLEKADTRIGALKAFLRYSKEQRAVYSRMGKLNKEHGVKMGFWRGTKKLEEKWEQAHLKVNELSEAKGQNETILQGVEQIKKEVEASLALIRGNILEGFAGIQGLAEVIQNKINEQFDQLINKNPDFKKLDEAQKRFEELAAMEDDDDTGINPLNKKPEELQKKIDERVTGIAIEKIGNAVNSIKVGDGALEKFEKSLVELLQREKLGDMEGNRAKEFIIESVDASMKDNINLNTPEGKAKRMICARFIAKVRKLIN